VSRQPSGQRPAVELEQIVSFIPCFNAAPTIGDTIRSVVAQQHPGLELVVVDDGSCDETSRVVRTAARGLDRFVFAAQLNRGVSAARNHGNALVTGKYVQYLDADDVLTPGTLTARVNELETHAADIALCDFEVCDYRFDAAPSIQVHENSLGDRPDCDFLAGAWWPPGAYLLRRSLLERLDGWNERLRTNQDVQFLILAACAGAKFVRAQHVGLKYRVRQASLSNGDPRIFFEDAYLNACELHSRWSEAGQLDDRRSAALCRVFRYLRRVLSSNDSCCVDMALRLASIAKK
jgi:glycosyltransferase involved in cell wall biosynthesis